MNKQNKYLYGIVTPKRYIRWELLSTNYLFHLAEFVVVRSDV